MSAVHLCGVFQASAKLVKTQLCCNLLKIFSCILFSLIPLMKTTQILGRLGELELKLCIFIGWLLVVRVGIKFLHGSFFSKICDRLDSPRNQWRRRFMERLWVTKWRTGAGAPLENMWNRVLKIYEGLTEGSVRVTACWAQRRQLVHQVQVDFVVTVT